MELSHHSSMAIQWQRGMVAVQKHHQNGNGTSMYCQVFSGGSDGKGSAHSAGDLGLIPGLGRSPEERKDYPLQYSGLDNSTDCIVHGVAKCQTWLSDFHFTCWTQVFPGSSAGKESSAMQETWVLSWVGEIPWRRATHSSILAWRIPWTEVPGGL